MNSQPLLLAPSLLSADFARLSEEIARVQPEADWLHLDVMDGHFVPNITFGPDLVRAVRDVTRLPLDVHLMIEEPDRHLEAFARAGADRLTVHVEACPHLQRTLQHIRDLGCRAGVALNPHTPLENIRYVLEDVDLVLLMTVNPGFGGQKFLPAVLPKVKRLAAWLRLGGRQIHIEVDGGINTETAPLVVAAGANVLVAGSAVFGAPDPVAVLRALRAARG
ncbi:MAG: ribulose-phosphate 3-epimerase [Firmicutes bacterium ZCTH02-B6]|nr:MAG: ribulose-phosphate 3-epimerase [Firmicutes bacterium ZCTH02-B6]